MKQLTSKMKTRLKIVGSTAFVIFTLLTVFTATIAWFASNLNVTATDMKVSIAAVKGATIKSIKLIKFVYGVDQFDKPDYLNPNNGVVSSYEYDKTSGSFGYYENAQWVPVNSMNVYDPIENRVNGGDITKMNCNAIYEISFAPFGPNNIMDLSAKRFLDGTHLPSVLEEDNEVSLADYMVAMTNYQKLVI